ncbi:MAG: hypothetical protein P4L65_00505 [Legionella sp.]|nr:hypothetical protein [Legionella sp.]
MSRHSGIGLLVVMHVGFFHNAEKRPLTPQQDVAVVASRTVQAQAWINEFAEQEIVATNTSSQSSAPTQAWIDGHVHVEQPS